MTWTVIRIFFREYYDELFKMIGVNIVWLLTLVPIVTIPASFIAMYEFSHGVLNRQDPEIRSFFGSIKKWFWKSFPIYGLAISALVIPLVGLVFYTKMIPHWGIVAHILVAVSFWLFVFVLMCLIYYVPLIVHQNIPILKAAKRSALLVLLRPMMSIVVLFLLAILYFAWSFPPILVFLSASSVALLKTAATLVGLEDYEE